MQKLLIGLLAALFLFVTGSFITAAQKNAQGTKEEAKAMVEKAAEWFKKYGREKTLAEITRAGTEKKGEFIYRDLYIFAYDFDGVVLAHGANPKLIGRNLIDQQDADGRYLIRGLIDTAKKGRGWYYFKWPNPITKKTDDKKAYVLKLDDNLWIGCGVYGKEAEK
jgi:methyl-accepting chemotaxis protein